MSENSLKKGLNDNIHIHHNLLIRGFFLIGGFVLVGIGILGILLPLLPTTIFFILAALCFARSSEKFHHWLHKNKFFGKYLSNYRVKGGMTLKSKIFSILFLTAGITFSILYATENLLIRILLSAIGIGVSWHIITLKTIKQESE